MMRLLDPWDKKKQDMFLEYGFQVAVLNGMRIVSGTEIRCEIDLKNDAWKEKVPAGSKRVIEDWLIQHPDLR